MHVGFRMVGCVLMVVCMVGCAAGGGADAGPAAGGQEPPLEYPEAARRVALARCEKEERCAELEGRRNASLEDCNATVESQAGYRLEDAATHTVDQTKLAACLVELGSHTCGAPQTTMTCAEALARIPALNIPTGEPCGLHTTGDCGPTDVCTYQESLTGCLICKKRPALGETCGGAVTVICIGDTSCPVSQPGQQATCVPLKTKGDGCSSGEACAFNFLCMDAPDGGATCQERVGVGQRCSNGTCFDGQECGPDRRCVQLTADGSPCTRAPAMGHFKRCRSNLCKFLGQRDPAGVCAPANSQLPTDFQACWGNGDGINTICARGFHAEPGTQAGMMDTCVCRVSKPVGAGCSGASDCASSICHGATNTLGSVCASEPALGDLCGDGGDGDCGVGFCDQMQQPAQCVATPACQ